MSRPDVPAPEGDLIAVANAGSSSLKFSLYRRTPGEPEPVLRGLIDGLGDTPRFTARSPAGEVIGEQTWATGATLGHDAALHHVIEFVRGLMPGVSLAGIGHRVVHGGVAFSEPVLVTPERLAALEALTPLAPLHQPNNLAPIRLAQQVLPGMPQVACFDTAFHHGNDEVTQMFALPYELHEAGIRRYGFHGLSYEYIASRLPKVDAERAAGRVIAAHLGNGASLCAMSNGRSVASTMGFTAVDGLVMGTRCGTIDPGVLLYLMDERGLDARAIERLIYRESGLLGVSGLSADMRVLLASDAPRARLAVDLFVNRIVREVGSLAAALGGLDAIVFTAGIGEHAAEVRRRVVAGCAWLGATLDETANAAGHACISKPGSRCAVFVVPTDEELMIARHTERVLDTLQEDPP